MIHTVNAITTMPSTNQYNVWRVRRKVINDWSSGRSPTCARMPEAFEAFDAFFARVTFTVVFFAAGAFLLVDFLVAINTVYTLVLKTSLNYNEK